MIVVWLLINWMVCVTKIANNIVYCKCELLISEVETMKSYFS